MTRFVWDRKKARSNLEKHGVSFELAESVFEDPWQVSDRDICGEEERWQTMGLIRDALVLLVVHTVEQSGDDEEIRIISARKATRSERRAYDEAQQKARQGD